VPGMSPVNLAIEQNHHCSPYPGPGDKAGPFSLNCRENALPV
jgi:hypothetical protein